MGLKVDVRKERRGDNYMIVSSTSGKRGRDAPGALGMNPERHAAIWGVEQGGSNVNWPHITRIFASFRALQMNTHRTAFFNILEQLWKDGSIPAEAEPFFLKWGGITEPPKRAQDVAAKKWKEMATAAKEAKKRTFAEEQQKLQERVQKEMQKLQELQDRKRKQIDDVKSARNIREEDEAGQ